MWTISRTSAVAELCAGSGGQRSDGVSSSDVFKMFTLVLEYFQSFSEIVLSKLFSEHFRRHSSRSSAGADLDRETLAKKKPGRALDSLLTAQ